jgi:chaperonin GroEL
VNKSVGDGTTTTAILVHAFAREAHKWIVAGVDPGPLAEAVRGVLEGFEDALETVWHEPGEDPEVLFAVARTACNGDEVLAAAIVEAINSVGTAGMVSVEEGKSVGVEVVQKQGLEIDWGYESVEMAAEDSAERHLDVPIVALIDAELTKIQEVQTILEEATQFPHPLLIVSRGCRSRALETLVTNDRKLELPDGRKFECVAVRAPGHQDQKRDHLDDLAALTGATVLDPLVCPLNKFEPSMFGSAQTITVARRKTTFVAFEDNYDTIIERVEELELRKQSASNSHEVELLSERAAQLSEGFCLLRIGGTSDIEIRERRGRVEDALNSVRATFEEGIVPGGTLTYVALANLIERQQRPEAGPFDLHNVGSRVLAEALRAPFKLLVKNAGAEPEVVLHELTKPYKSSGDGLLTWTGWDPKTGEIRDFREEPRIFDPLRVVRTVIQVAVSAALTLISAETALTNR